jgi:O-antigen ligase/Flp pilus assembly protein TadD
VREAQRSAEHRLPIADQILFGLALLSIALVPVVIYPQLYYTVLAKDLAFGALALLMAAALVVKAVARQPISCPRAHLNLGIWAMLIVSLLSAAFSRYWYAAAGAVAGLAVGMLFYFVVIVAVKTRDQTLRVAVAAAIGAGLSSIYAILQHFGIDFVKWATTGTRIQGPYGNPTYFASYLVLLLPLMLIMTIFPPPRSRAMWRLFFAAATVLMGAALIFSGTVGAILGLALSLALLTAGFTFVHFSKEGRRTRAVLLALACLTAALALVFVAMPTPIRERVLSLRRPSDTSDATRVMVWRGAARIFLDHPILGAGPGSFKIVSRGRYIPFIVGGRKLEAAGASHAHNAILETLAEIGALGGVALVWLLMAYFAAAWRVLAAAADPFWKHLVAGLAAGVTAFLVQNVFAVTFFIPSCQMFFWLALGLTANAASSAQPQTARAFTVRPAPLRIAAVACTSAALPLICWLMWRTLSADHYLWRGFHLAVAGEHEVAAQVLKEAVNTNPYAQRAWYQLSIEEVRLGNLSAGLYALEHSAALSPDFMRTQLNLGALYAASGRYEDAEQALLRAASYEPSADTFLSLSRVCLRLGKRDHAIDNARQAEHIDPYNAGVQRDVAYVMLSAGDLDAARLYASRAEELEPASPETAALKARVAAASASPLRPTSAR